ncbi:NUDIX hydrolase [Arcicella sp. DC2W]|uniref:NUDIX hydrolase n=1 Tax=Arcicella gelida TaxID=2984195 RepID=A0ABU5S8G6_9BACT|nr:NUDIX hydrolase [Arcicella sp. DC2W]MEA5404770.1 NUDIX hydrolase [Arcicella sp. DC2W]
MHRNQLLQLLEKYQPYNATDSKFQEEIISFVKANSTCFERSLLVGHVTGSAWILDKSRQYTLLTHHKKLNQWFQTGGHCDGDSDVLNVALKEAKEETGLKNIKVLSPDIFDIDIHLIPERKGIPVHLHFDVRFLLEADMNEALIVSSESTDLKWIPLSEVAELNDSDSIMRMVEKSIF